MSQDAITLAQLAERSGIPARTIRFYISRGLVDGPIKAGRGAAYTAQHIARLEKIKALQAQGRMLSEIGPMLAPGQPSTTLSSTPWWQHAVSEDVLVWTRAEVSPWRMKQIRAAVDEIAKRLAKKED